MPRYKKIKRGRKRDHEHYESLISKMEQGPLKGMKYVIEPGGKVKMSEVLGAFVEPYAEGADSEEAYRKLLTLGVVAWNASFFPEDERQAMIDKVLDEGIPQGSKELKRGLKNIVNELLARKLAYFAEYTRDILDFQVTDTGTGYHLSVVSTLEEANGS